VPLSDPVVTRRIGLIRRQGRRLSPEAQQLYDFLAAMKKASRPRTGQTARK
jgi:DNA-binding transcriptional LysR family regulator